MERSGDSDTKSYTTRREPPLRTGGRPPTFGPRHSSKVAFQGLDPSDGSRHKIATSVGMNGIHGCYLTPLHPRRSLYLANNRTFLAQRFRVFRVRSLAALLNRMLTAGTNPGESRWGSGSKPTREARAKVLPSGFAKSGNSSGALEGGTESAPGLQVMITSLDKPQKGTRGTKQTPCPASARLSGLLRLLCFFVAIPMAELRFIASLGSRHEVVPSTARS